MDNIFLRTVGVDVSFKTLDICFGQIDRERNIEFTKSFSVPNNLSGFKQIIQKIKKSNATGIEILSNGSDRYIS